MINQQKKVNNAIIMALFTILTTLKDNDLKFNEDTLKLYEELNKIYINLKGGD